MLIRIVSSSSFHEYSLFFVNDTATTEIYTLSLHDALPIFEAEPVQGHGQQRDRDLLAGGEQHVHLSRIGRVRDAGDRKSTRLNSSHGSISYAVFCLKKKKTMTPIGGVKKSKLRCRVPTRAT